MSFLTNLKAAILRTIAATEPELVIVAEAELPQFAPFIAAIDALYQAEIKNPGALKAGVTVPIDIQGEKLQITSGPRA